MFLVKQYDSLLKIKKYCFTNLPDRTKIFLSALWFWVYIVYYFNVIICYLLRFVLVNTPDSCIAFQSKIIKKKDNVPEIIKATMGSDVITNKIKLLINLCWDNEISDLGGVNVKDLIERFPSISSSSILISYIFDLEKKIKNMNAEEIGKTIKHIMINFTDKVIYRDNKSEEMLFGEIPF